MTDGSVSLSSNPLGSPFGKVFSRVSPCLNLSGSRAGWSVGCSSVQPSSLRSEPKPRRKLSRRSRNWEGRSLLTKSNRASPVIGVELSGFRVTDAGLKNLKKLSNLQRLDLRSTRVADAGLKELKELKNLPTAGPPLDEGHGCRPEGPERTQESANRRPCPHRGRPSSQSLCAEIEPGAPTHSCGWTRSMEHTGNNHLPSRSSPCRRIRAG